MHIMGFVNIIVHDETRDRLNKLKMMVTKKNKIKDSLNKTKKKIR